MIWQQVTVSARISGCILQILIDFYLPCNLIVCLPNYTQFFVGGGGGGGGGVVGEHDVIRKGETSCVHTTLLNIKLTWSYGCEDYI